MRYFNVMILGPAQSPYEGVPLHLFQLAYLLYLQSVCSSCCNACVVACRFDFVNPVCSILLPPFVSEEVANEQWTSVHGLGLPLRTWSSKRNTACSTIYNYALHIHIQTSFYVYSSITTANFQSKLQILDFLVDLVFSSVFSGIYILCHDSLLLLHGSSI